MKFLLDTHVLLWALTNSSMMQDKIKELIMDPKNEIYYSIISVWEIEIKRLMHPDQMSLTAEAFSDFCRKSGYTCVPVKEEHIIYLEKLKRADGAPPHRDPFDRMMICQAVKEGMIFMTHDKLLSDYREPVVYVI